MQLQIPDLIHAIFHLSKIYYWMDILFFNTLKHEINLDSI
jgi:hypothetical protein